MPVTELNHFLIRANDLERTKDFYCKCSASNDAAARLPVSRLLAGA